MKTLLTLLLAFLSIAAAAAPADTENIYTVHSGSHKLIALRGFVFRAHGGIFYTHELNDKQHIVYARRLVPGQPEASCRIVARIPYTEQDSPGARAFTSHTKRQAYDEDGGNVYVIPDRREDNAAEVEVKNMPQGYSILQSAAVPHEGKLLLILEEEATRNRCFAFLNVASGMLDEKRYPGASDSAALIWRGGNLVWQITAGRLCSLFSIYDLERGEYLKDDDACAAYYSSMVPMYRALIGIKSNSDVDIITPLDPPRVAANAPAPSDTTLYGIPEQPSDTLLCSPGKVYAADADTFYRISDGLVYERRIIRETHMLDRPVFDTAGYVNANPGQNHIISHRYSEDIHLHGGDVILMPEGSAATPLRVKNLPSGYVIDACAAVPYEGKLALHLTHEAEGKCAYALLDTATAALEGPLYPAPASRPAALIQRSADVIWEITQANAWEIPLTAYSLRAGRRVFQTWIDTPKGICILGNTAVELSLGDQLHRLYTLQDLAPTGDTIYLASNGTIKQLSGKALLADGQRIYLAEKMHYEKPCISNMPAVPRIVSVSVQAYTIQNDRLVKEGEPICIPVTPDITATDEETSWRLERNLIHPRCGDVYITPMTKDQYAPRLAIPNLPADFTIAGCSASPVDGHIIVLLENSKTKEYYFSKLDVRTGRLVGELYPGAERCTHFIIWRGGDIIHQITPGPGTSDYRTYSLSAKAYTTPLCRKHKTQYILISGDKLWEVTLPQ